MRRSALDVVANDLLVRSVYPHFGQSPIDPFEKRPPFRESDIGSIHRRQLVQGLHAITPVVPANDLASRHLARNQTIDLPGKQALEILRVGSRLFDRKVILLPRSVKVISIAPFLVRPITFPGKSDNLAKENPFPFLT